MANGNMIRSAKSGNEWTMNELNAYNIQITFQDAATFFGVVPLPPPAVSQDFLTALDTDDAVDERVYNLLTQLDLAMLPSEPDESTVDNFAILLFHSLELHLLVCGETKYAKPDICIIDRSANDIILLIQGDKRFYSGADPHAQLITEAIAAFPTNNLRRLTAGLEKLDSKIISGIIMIGTAPSFFKIPVTKQLSQCVAQGQYPLSPTIVTRHVPDLPRPNRRFSEGMKPLDNQQVILQC
ncbi:hypothetical protein PC9H_008820 [Pleurotus ostreatus]|uniref:Uncharacterized protein n=1 Tax=Pleurotus ostreatus TaxID=5322 RepID=A0A8H7DTG6_PLEOS|nr:uncharacterized protein PC9H_008820 [Pleurotus ostreatus]KAF7426451.1 hypothetical protein PC9H_008820 [Pleurotus ostreatus]KAJ8693998.1 hypothetical protein PTI98_008931 [Pleurotus ostreatus]